MDPGHPVSGAWAFDLHIALTLPLLRKTGRDLTMLGQGGPWMIGPAGEHWDILMLVRQASLQSFMAFAQDPDYLPILVQRSAAIRDSRLLPFRDRPLQA